MTLSSVWMCVAAVVVAATLSVLDAQAPPEPKPAFPGQTDAPAPRQPSPAIAVEQIASGLASAWAFAFLPDGSLLTTQNTGTMRVVGRDGSVSAPLEGVPPVKAVAAQGLHDVVLDPDFARNRLIYFTYFAPPKPAPGRSSISTSRSGPGRSPNGGRWTSGPSGWRARG